MRRDQFAEFAKAVQVGLLDYQGPQGVKAFFSLMRSRYGGQVRTGEGRTGTCHVAMYPINGTVPCDTLLIVLY